MHCGPSNQINAWSYFHQPRRLNGSVDNYEFEQELARNLDDYFSNGMRNMYQITDTTLSRLDMGAVDILISFSVPSSILGDVIERF